MPSTRQPVGLDELQLISKYVKDQREQLTAFNNALGCDAYGPEAEQAARCASRLSDTFGNLSEALRKAAYWAEEWAEEDEYEDYPIPKMWRKKAAR